jgi:hypothetical protein
MQFAQIFSLLMALSGFGVDANPNAPTADQVLEHSVDDADLIVHFDVAAVLPRNFKALVDLPNLPAIKADKDVQAMLKDVAAQANQGRAMVKSMAGFDPITDVTSITAYAKFTKVGAPPDFLVEVRGSVPADVVSKIAQATGSPLETFGGRSAVVIDKQYYLGVAKSGSMLFGTAAWVKPRLADTWKPAVRPAGSRAARVAALLDEKPFLLYAVQPSATLIALTEQGGKNPASAMLKDVDQVIASMRFDGLAWATYSKSAAGVERASMFAEGAIDLMRAFQIAPRGFAKVALAYLDTFAGQSKELDEVIKHKADILKIVDEFSGDGQFKAQIDKDAKAKGVVVHATAKHLSEVLPLGLIIPIGATSFLLAGRSAGAMPSPNAVPAGKPVTATPGAKHSAPAPRPCNPPPCHDTP